VNGVCRLVATTRVFRVSTRRSIAIGCFVLGLAGCGVISDSSGNDNRSNGGGDAGGDNSGGGNGGTGASKGDAGVVTPPVLPVGGLDGGSGNVNVPPDLALVACMPACGANQVCHNGSCENLPGSCPCPMGAYCDLTSNTCKQGCLADGDCDAGQYCDTTTRACRPGCRSTADCRAMADVCANHVCGNSCGTCDDGNPCTSDSCVRNECQNNAVADGTKCPDDGNPCTSDFCSAATCTHPSASDGTNCPDDGIVCTSDICKSGACTHPNMPDDTLCGHAGVTPEYCQAGACKQPALSCVCSSQGSCLVYDGTSAPQQVIDCFCIDSRDFQFDVSPSSVDSAGCNACGQLASNVVCF
jgi:hypothetical protein